MTSFELYSPRLFIIFRDIKFFLDEGAPKFKDEKFSNFKSVLRISPRNINGANFIYLIRLILKTKILLRNFPRSNILSLFKHFSYKDFLI